MRGERYWREEPLVLFALFQDRCVSDQKRSQLSSVEEIRTGEPDQVVDSSYFARRSSCVASRSHLTEIQANTVSYSYGAPLQVSTLDFDPLTGNCSCRGTL